MSETGDITSVVIVGHVDHGKSTFIGRLLFDTKNLSADRLADVQKASDEQGRRLEYAYVTDQFEEEREKNVTIDTSQTFLTIAGRPFLIIDAPGHKEYLKNMITGATQARNGIIMLDVNEGVREQTEKHARILKLLGIRHVAVMVNKMDLKDFSEDVFRAFEAEIGRLMREWGVPAQAVVPLSAYNGDNVVERSAKMTWYQGPTALDYLQGCTDTRDDVTGRPLRFPIQIVSDDAGRPLLMGRVEEGQVSVGQALTLFPTSRSVRVEKILKHKETPSSAGQGECIALMVDGETSFKRGQVLTDSVVDKAAARVKVHAFWAAAEPLRPGDEVVVECRTQSGAFTVERVADQIEQQGLAQLNPGDVGEIELRSSTPMLLESIDQGEALSRIVFHRNGQVAGCGVVSHVG